MLPLAAIIGPTLDWVAGILIALAVIAGAWKLVTRGAKLITLVDEEIAPNVKYMKDLPKINRVLDVVVELAGQVQRDHGSGLMDDMDALRATIDVLEKNVEALGGHASENRVAAKIAQQAAVEAGQAVIAATEAATENARINAKGIAALEVLMGTAREHAQDDRALARDDRDLARDALEQIRNLLASAHRTEASGERVEASGARTEASGARTEAADEIVAHDLAARDRRADDVAGEAPGAAADAASQSAEGTNDVS